MEEQFSYDLAQARVAVIVNPGSGRQDGDAIAMRIRDRLEARVAAFEIRRVARGADLPAAAGEALAAGSDLVVAIGGDGTQAAIASVLAGTDAVMAVVPGGTFNYFSRDLGIGQSVDEALAVLDRPALRRIDTGEINGMLFLNNVSFGAYPEILKRREDIYRRWGRSRLAAYWSAVVAMWNLRHPIRLTLRAEGKEHHFTTALAFVARSAYQLENFGLDGAADVRAGRLAVLVARARYPWPLVRSALRLALGNSARYQDFDLVSAEEMEIEALPRHEYIAHDGEKCWMDSPFRIRVRAGALRVLVPAADGGPDRE